MSILKNSPFNLDWGAKVFAKIMATNIKGNSLVSDPGTGATIISNPDAPVDLTEIYSLRTAT